MDFRFDIAALCVAFAGVLWLIYRRDRARKRAVRGAYFDECRSLIEDCCVTFEGIEFPVLDGRYGGQQIRLEPIVDHMAVRKLPSLWLKVSVFGDLPIAGTIDFLVRPLNTEFFSPSADLPITVRIPLEWPQHALLRTDLQSDFLPIRILHPHVGLFADPKMKELVIAPRGVRLVFQENQGERAYYMVLRQANFGASKLSAALARRLLDEAVAVYNTVASSQEYGVRESSKTTSNTAAREA
jgi:hypothetical protein